QRTQRGRHPQPALRPLNSRLPEENGTRKDAGRKPAEKRGSDRDLTTSPIRALPRHPRGAAPVPVFLRSSFPQSALGESLRCAKISTVSSTENTEVTKRSGSQWASRLIFLSVCSVPSVRNLYSAWRSLRERPF